MPDSAIPRPGPRPPTRPKPTATQPEGQSGFGGSIPAEAYVGDEPAFEGFEQPTPPAAAEGGMLITHTAPPLEVRSPAAQPHPPLSSMAVVPAQNAPPPVMEGNAIVAGGQRVEQPRAVDFDTLPHSTRHEMKMGREALMGIRPTRAPPRGE